MISQMLWQHEADLHNIRKLAPMLSPMSVIHYLHHIQLKNMFDYNSYWLITNRFLDNINYFAIYDVSLHGLRLDVTQTPVLRLVKGKLDIFVCWCVCLSIWPWLSDQLLFLNEITPVTLQSLHAAVLKKNQKNASLPPCSVIYAPYWFSLQRDR